ncbi:MAG: hypothetical protein IT259_10120 [Saprospiraceae bacterium]|nr:hypothetical protein [Saprospiraceae bacterium]
MSIRRVILLLTLSVFSLWANRAWACDDEHSQDTTKTEQTGVEKSCCSENDGVPASCSDDSRHQHSDGNCPCDHDNGGCHCPGCGLMCHSGAASALETPLTFAASLFNDSVRKMAFYFAEHLPEAVYLPIWQPPKIGA